VAYNSAYVRAKGLLIAACLLGRLRLIFDGGLATLNITTGFDATKKANQFKSDYRQN
jgi:hypothetical protein